MSWPSTDFEVAIQTELDELRERANHLPGLTATLDELFGVVDNVRQWLRAAGDESAISEHDYQELDAILNETPERPKWPPLSNSTQRKDET